MLLQEAIRSRRSVRRYDQREVELDCLLALVDCGRQAPTAANLQAWEFILVRETQAVEALVSLAPGIAAGARAVIVICADREKARRKAGQGGELFGLMDACFAAQNILLAATEAGLGACVVRSFHQQAVQRLVGAPEQVVPELLITLGYPDGALPKGPRRRPLEDVVHLERWGRRCEVDQYGDQSGGRDKPAEEADPISPVGDAWSTVGVDSPWPPQTDKRLTETVGPVGSKSWVLALQSTLAQYLGYLATSACGLLSEPAAYGPYRLIDFLGRLIDTMDRFGLAEPKLRTVRRLVEDGKLSVMDDPGTFRRVLDEALRVLTERVP